MDKFKSLRFTRQGAIGRIQFNRPDQGNGLDVQTVEELNQAARICAADPILKVIILSAEGRFFSVGGDLKVMHAQGDQVDIALKALADTLHQAIATLCQMDAALLVAVNGIAAGAGFSLTMIGDIVLAARSASFTMAYTKAGLSPDGSSSYFLPRLVGLRKAQELMLTNNTLTADQALAMGLVTKVVEDDLLSVETEKLAAQIATGARGSIAGVKRLLLSSYDHNLEDQMAAEALQIADCAASMDGREGMQAFIEKRKPAFE